MHRDLKPANVLVTRDGQVRITDFGLVGRPGLSTLTIPPRPGLPASLPPAAVSGSWSTLTMGDVLMGTPPYMPPEQWDGAHLVGPPGDVYAFGCILYELVAGRRPFQLEGGAEMLNAEVRLAAWERLHRAVPRSRSRRAAPRSGPRAGGAGTAVPREGPGTAAFELRRGAGVPDARLGSRGRPAVRAG
ncbi:MAG: hypothetical protein AB2L07_04920 [Thermoanaerobaculaceae bacterium]